jgi:hypothetical protein
MAPKPFTTLDQLRADIAQGCREAAAVYRNSPELGKRASGMADRLDADAQRWEAKRARTA